MSLRIELPITTWERTGAVLLIGGAAVAAAISPVDLAVRGAIAVLTVFVGLLQWWRHCRRRPRALLIADDKDLVVERAGGSLAVVAEVRTGVVRPAFVSARLRLTSGEHADLFLPGGGLTEQEHWQVRRALLRHRPDASSA